MQDENEVEVAINGVVSGYDMTLTKIAQPEHEPSNKLVKPTRR